MKAAKRLLCTWQQLQAILLVYERMRTEENPAVPLNKQLVLATINQRNGRCMVSLRMASMDECLTETERVALIKCIGSYREAGQCPLCVEALPYTLNARFVVCQVSVTGPAAAAFDEPRMQLYRMLLACARQTLHVLASLSSGSRDDTCLVMKEMEPSADNPDRPALFDAPFTMIRLYATQLFIQGGDAAPVPDDSTATPYTTGSLPTTTSASTTTTTTTTPTAAASQ